MKRIISVLLTVFVLAASSPAFARGGYYGHHHNYSHYGYSDGVAELAAGLLLGSFLIYALSPPPPSRAIYAPQQVPYQPEVVVQQPRVCVEKRVVSGEWQRSPYDGARVWVSFPYPMPRTFQTPCY